VWITVPQLLKNRQQSGDYRLIRDTWKAMILTNLQHPDAELVPSAKALLEIHFIHSCYIMLY